MCVFARVVGLLDQTNCVCILNVTMVLHVHTLTAHHIISIDSRVLGICSEGKSYSYFYCYYFNKLSAQDRKFAQAI